tara:strand:+ start:178 stop:687 length:510 start_codon:yes stop_codon:yes gene_type:complete
MNQNIVNQINNRLENVQSNVNNLGNNVNNLGNNVNNLGSNVNELSNNISNLESNLMLVNSQNYPVDKNSKVPLHKRWNSPDEEAPPPVPNGGIYGGPQAVGDYASIHVTPTATNLINNNLKSANPPPGATEQYPGTNRLGNNYIAMPGVFWYSDTHPVNKGPYSMKVTK